MATNIPGITASTLPLASLYDRLNSTERGLTGGEAGKRLAVTGPNEPVSVRRAAYVGELFRLLFNPLTLILLSASVVSIFLGEAINAAIIVTIVLLSLVLNFVQSFRSHRAAERLRETVAPIATALRDGRWTELARRKLVPGDIVRLSAGDMIPADGRLIEAVDLHVQQAALTGESLPVMKAAGDLANAPADVGATSNMVYMGTSVVSGSGIALIVSTGKRTSFGEIAAHLARRPPETEFQRGTRQFGLLITRTVFFLVLFVFLVNAALHRDAFESLLFAVALAVGLTPEFLPMIFAVTLAQGSVRMARQKVIVKRLEAIENLGSIDVLCSDKTGTLTSGQMRLDKIVDSLGTPNSDPLLLAYLNSYFETGIKSPLDAAILAHDTFDVGAYEKLGEVPFDFDRRRLSVVVKHGDESLLITKGAPESILALCDSYVSDGRVAPMTPEVKVQARAVYEGLSAQGYRVLAVAYQSTVVPLVFTARDERDLVLSGFVAFFDPPLEETQEMLSVLERDGVKIKILTGDNELVARHVCETVGLDGSSLVLGVELEQMTDAAIGHVVERNTVFARVSPAQKNRIILALKQRGHVVGFLGDGVNDAPSLHAADVGISVVNGVDAAKDAADIILGERSLRVLHTGIMEGRRAFGNVMKYLLMGTSSNFGNMFSMAGASLFLPFLPMLPTQILLNNFLYDVSQVTIPTDNVDPSFIQKPRKWDIGLLRDFMVFIGPISSLYDFITFFVLLSVLHASEELFHTGWFIESLATQTLVLFVIRTAGNPLRSRPSAPLTITVILVILTALLLPLSPMAALLGLAPLSLGYYAFLLAASSTYLVFVEFAKRRLMRRFAL